jgi:hypothetical protein
MTDILKALNSAQFLFDTNGQQVAVQLSMSAWETLLDWVETQEDSAIVKAAIPQLKKLENTLDNDQLVDWDEVKDKWDED